jgi:phage baseplate assembly protein gpV
MSDMVEILRALVRDELARRAAPQLGTVTSLFAHESGSSDGNHQVNVKLRDSGVELQRVPVTVSRLGLSMLPRVDDLVLVVFVGGDVNAPVVVGSLYDEALQPPEAKAEEVVYQPTDAEDSALRRLHVELVNGSVVTLDDEKLTVQLGGTTLVIHKDGDVVIEGAGKLEIKTDGDITIEAGGNLELKAQANVTVKAGAQLALEGGAAAQLKGPAVTLAGNTSFSPG